MNRAAPAPAIEEFPQEARAFLEAFYTARHVHGGSAEAKIKVIREAYGLEDAIVTADGGLDTAADELRALEFYVLTKNKII